MYKDRSHLEKQLQENTIYLKRNAEVMNDLIKVLMKD